jgi:hypothetical protein
MAATLGELYPAFQAMTRRGGEATAEWRRYSKNTPWVLKVSKGRQALFYARPDSGALEVTVLLGARAVEAALAGAVSKQLHAAIREARAFPEGRPVNVWIKRPSDLAKIDELITVKLETRANRPRRRA